MALVVVMGCRPLAVGYWLLLGGALLRMFRRITTGLLANDLNDRLNRVTLCRSLSRVFRENNI